MQRIHTIGVLSLGKILGALYFALSLLLLPLFFFFAWLAPGGLPGGVWSVLLALIVPLFYGAIGLLTGLLVGALYNVLAEWVGGIEVELEGAPVAGRREPLATLPPGSGGGGL